MAVKTIIYDSSKQEKNSSSADWDAIIKLKDGESITIMPLRRPNTNTPERNGKYAEFQFYFRDIWFPAGDKPASLKGRSIKLPVLDFEAPNSDHLSPANYMKAHENDFKTPGGKPLSISALRRDIKMVVLASEIYNSSDPNALKNVAYKLNKQMIFAPSLTVYVQLLSLWESSVAENGEDETIGVPIRITRSGSTMNDTRYSVEFIHHKKSAVGVNPLTVDVELDLEAYIGMTTFKGQISFLDKCGYSLPINNPDGEDEETPMLDEEDEDVAA